MCGKILTISYKHILKSKYFGDYLSQKKLIRLYLDLHAKMKSKY